MPATPLSQRQANLTRLRGSLSAHCAESAAGASNAQNLAAKMPLTHATPFGNLTKILGNKALLSQVQLGRRPGHAETVIGTTDDVFLYAAAFSYPGTECGFLFTRSVEDAHISDGIATPFDSGALAVKITPPTPYVDGVSFVRDHELPVSDYRSIMGTVIADYSPSVDQYLDQPDVISCACGAQRYHPFGLSDGDHRAATFEVRVPQRVQLQPPHLLAVFVRKGFETAELHELFAQGVRIERYEAENDDDFFHALRVSCITFIREHFIP